MNRIIPAGIQPLVDAMRPQEQKFWWLHLRGANLRGANLWGADLRNANLQSADLRGADLWGGLAVQAGISGSGDLRPTPDGWRISIGCWKHHTLDDLDDLIHDRVDWPEAKGNQRDKRRPMLIAVHALCLAHIAQQPDDIITNLDKKWNHA